MRLSPSPSPSIDDDDNDDDDGFINEVSEVREREWGDWTQRPRIKRRKKNKPSHLIGGQSSNAASLKDSSARSPPGSPVTITSIDIIVIGGRLKTGCLQALEAAIVCLMRNGRNKKWRLNWQKRPNSQRKKTKGGRAGFEWIFFTVSRSRSSAREPAGLRKKSRVVVRVSWNYFFFCLNEDGAGPLGHQLMLFWNDEGSYVFSNFLCPLKAFIFVSHLDFWKPNKSET